jgi:quercetin dioxygenase-like cupin family protein
VQPIRGRFAFTAGDDEREVVPGTLVSVEGGVRHAVRALEDGAFLLTIGWSSGVRPATRARLTIPIDAEGR